MSGVALSDPAYLESATISQYQSRHRVEVANRRRIAAQAAHIQDYLKIKQWRRRLRVAVSDLEWHFEPYRKHYEQVLRQRAAAKHEGGVERRQRADAAGARVWVAAMQQAADPEAHRRRATVEIAVGWKRSGVYHSCADGGHGLFVIPVERALGLMVHGHCVRCGGHDQQPTLFCPCCAKDMQSRDCARCGWHISESAQPPYRFCGRCGAVGAALTAVAEGADAV